MPPVEVPPMRSNSSSQRFPVRRSSSMSCKEGMRRSDGVAAFAYTKDRTALLYRTDRCSY